MADTPKPAAKAAKPAGEKAPKAAKAPAAVKAEKAEKSAPAEKATKSGTPGHVAVPLPPAPVVDPNAFSLDPNAIEPVKIVKAKGSKNILSGIANILATFNNTLVTVTDLNGNVIGWSSAGKCGFSGSKKSTAYVAQLVAQDACRQAMGHGLKEVVVNVKGPGTGRESAIRAMQAIGLEVTTIVDVTPVPHNGCRPRKQRRV